MPQRRWREIVKTARPHSEHGFEVGQDNVRVLGLDIHNPVFMVSAVLVVAFVVGTLLFLDSAGAAFSAMRVWITSKFDWLFMISMNVFVLFSLYVAFSKLGNVRLGGADAKPRYGYPSWLSMLFAAGVGIGLMFYGVLEPVTHTLHPPLGIDPADQKAAMAAGMSAAIFHWGLHAWGVYAVVGLALAFFCFNRGLPLVMRSAFYPLLGNRVRGGFGHVIDVTAVLATIFGLATSLGLGAEQLAGGLKYLFDIEPRGSIKILLITAIIALALASVVSGLDKGVKLLSEINMAMAGLLLLFIIVAGPSLFILKTMIVSVVDYGRHLIPLSNWIGREDTAFYHGWSTFYWAWWVAWSPFVSMFIARISYGRTAREFVTWVLIIPTLIGVIWMSTLGGTALHQLLVDGYRGVAEAVPELALFKMLEGLPFTNIVSTASLFLIAIFFVTSADSGSLVVDTITAGGKMDSPVIQRVFWCVLVGLVAIVLLLGGGINSLQALVISVGLPFCVVLLLMCVSLHKGLREEVDQSQ
ncbi:MAG: BCCT family transporter [Proteobacteria bacterium]|nr:BCCT family transporter [Pseudomonadota bacterium]